MDRPVYKAQIYQLTVSYTSCLAAIIVKEVAKQFLRVETDKTKASEKSGGLMAVV